MAERERDHAPRPDLPGDPVPDGDMSESSESGTPTSTDPQGASSVSVPDAELQQDINLLRSEAKSRFNPDWLAARFARIADRLEHYAQLRSAKRDAINGPSPTSAPAGGESGVTDELEASILGIFFGVEAQSYQPDDCEADIKAAFARFRAARRSAAGGENA